MSAIKRRILSAGLLAVLFVVSGGLVANSQAAGGNGKTDIVITVKGQTFQARLDNNDLTKKLVASLPKTISMEPLAGSNQIYGDTPITVKADLKRGMRKGDIAYCQYGYLILFYDDQPSNSTSSYIKVGAITSDRDKLQELADGANLGFALRK